MTAAITLAGPDHLPAFLSLMAGYHAERNLPHDDAHRAAVATPLLHGNPLGAVWLIGPARAPLGYVLVTFGWSVPLGGMVATVAEVFVRASVRKRGIGTEVVHAIAVSLKPAGVTALQARLDPDDTIARAFCARVGFRDVGTQIMMADIF